MSVSPLTTFCTQCGQELIASALFCPACGAPKNQGVDADLLVGQVLGQRFLVVQRMGHGGSGTIYRGEHTTLRRKVAIKVLHHELCRDELAVERFRREATTVSEIDNDHIVEIYDFGRTPDERLYLVMELLEGETLQQALEREKRLSVDSVLDILIQIGETLIEAHAMGYVHRDLRPCNVYLAIRRGRSNFVKLLDFGLAKLVENEGNAATTSLGMSFGDPKYMSPEQARGDTIDRRADIYSLGCIAYEMLVGHAPFARGKAFDILAKHADSIPPEPLTLRDDIPTWLNATIMQMLAKQPDERFITVFRLVKALRQGMATGQAMLSEVARRRETVPPQQESASGLRSPEENRPPATDSTTKTPKTIKTPTEDKKKPPTPTLIGAQALQDYGSSGVAKPTAPSETPPTEADSSVNIPGKSAVALATTRADIEQEDNPPSLSGAWFADGTLDKGEHLDQRQDEQLATACDNIAREQDSSYEDVYVDNSRKRLLLIGSVIGGLVLLLIIIVLAWPRDSKSNDNPDDNPSKQSSAANILATVRIPDAGVPTIDAVVMDAAASLKIAPKPTRRDNNRIAPEKKRSKPKKNSTSKKTTSSENAKRAAFFAQVGQTLLRNGNLSGAADNFGKALELNSRNGDAIMGRGEIALKQGSYTGAIRYLLRATRLNKRNPLSHTLLGEAYTKSGQHQKAADSFKRALRIDPDNKRARDGFIAADARIPPLPEDDI